MCCSFCAAYTPMHVYTHTNTILLQYALGLRPAFPGLGPSWIISSGPTPNGKDPPGLLCPALEGSCPGCPCRMVQPWGLAEGRVSRLYSLLIPCRGHISLLNGQVGCVGLNVGLLAATFHEEATGWAWDMKLLISCYLKLWSQILVGRNVVVQ